MRFKEPNLDITLLIHQMLFIIPEWMTTDVARRNSTMYNCHLAMRQIYFRR